MPSGTRSLRLALALLLAVASFPAAATAGAWTTYLRAQTYGDLVARHDTIWCASPEGGLLRYVQAADRFESIPREPNRLASQALSALEFDRSGRLWVGTLDHGVSRLSADGERWDLISELDGLPRGAIQVLRAVGDTMLVGTEHGVALWNGSEIAGTIPDGVNPSPFASDVITGVVLGGDSLWVATENGLYLSRVSTGLASWDLSFADTALLALAWDGHALVTAVAGVPLVLDPGTGTWVPPASSIGTVLALSDDRGVILASSDQGVFRWDGAGWVPVPGAPLSSSCSVQNNAFCHGIVVTTTDETGRVWGADRDGLHEGSGAGWALHEPDAPTGNDVQNIALQGSRVYIATYFEGVGRFDGTHWRNWFVDGCGGCDSGFVSSAYAFALLVDRQGRKWVGNWSQAVESFDDDASPSPQFTHFWTRPPDPAPYADEKHTFAWAADYDSSGGRWFGMSTNNLPEDPTPVGIDYYDPAGAYQANYQLGNTPAMPGNLVRALIVDRQRNFLWTGYQSKGVAVFRVPETPGGPLMTVAIPPAINTLDIFGLAAHKDSIWVMSTADLRLFGAGTRAQVGLAIPLVGSPAPRGACHPLDVGPDGTVWVGTDGGVHAYGPGGGTLEYTVLNSPLAGDEVRAIRVDPVTGVVWIGTATGLSRFDPAYVPPALPQPAMLEVRAYPNPAWLTGAGLSLRLAGNAAAYRGAVYDASGRRLHGFDGPNGLAFWDGRDASGHLVHPGVYFVRVEANGRARTLRVALLR